MLNGKGKIYEEEFNGLAIIDAKDYYFNQYLVTILSCNKQDWFNEKNIEIVFERKFKKEEKFKVALALNIKGLDIIYKKIYEMPNRYNNILEKVNIYKEYKAYKNTYAVLIWTSTYWPENNFIVRCIEDSFKELRENNLAYKQIIIGETDKTYIKINEFIDNDRNVDIFNIFQKIEIKNIGGILV